MIGTPVFCLVTHATALDSSRQVAQLAPQNHSTWGWPCASSIAWRPLGTATGTEFDSASVAPAGAACCAGATAGELAHEASETAMHTIDNRLQSDVPGR